MSEHADLHAQLAQRLFGWTPHTEWVLVDPARPRLGCCAFVSWQGPAGAHRLLPPAYTTDPAATAQVWHWVEGHGLDTLTFEYFPATQQIVCLVRLRNALTPLVVSGTTWPAALCRAALALAAALDKGEGELDVLP